MAHVTHSTEEIMQMQDDLIRITAELLKEADEKRKAGGSTDYTTFEIDSLVLVTHRTSKPTRMHTLWCSLIASLGGYNVSRLTRYIRYNTPRFQF